MVAQRPAITQKVANLPVMIINKGLVPLIQVEATDHLEFGDSIVWLGGCPDGLIHITKIWPGRSGVGCYCRPNRLNNMLLSTERVQVVGWLVP